MKQLKKFDSQKITKYWKNQTPVYSESSLFLDPYFPPNNSSLLGIDIYGNFIDKINGPAKSKEISTDQIEWKTIKEIFGEEFLIFENKIEIDDIKQGNLGNCYFLSAIASLTEFPYLIYRIFRTKEVNKMGYYEVAFFIDGEWQIVFIDEYFPVIKGTNELKFCKPNGNEMWAILLEKCWAKLNGGYSLIISGWPSDPLVALTGFPCEKILNKSLEENELFDLIKKYDKEQGIMCTSTINDKSIEALGLVVNHAYSLISVKSDVYKGEVIKLIKLRNPWGYKEWSGKFSDNSDVWDDELRSKFNEVQKDDGSFYISFDDYKKYFSNTQICHLMYNSYSRTFNLNYQFMISPLCFIFELEKDSKCCFSLIFKHWRYNRNFIGQQHPATMILVKLEGENFNKVTDFDGNYFSDDNVELIRDLKNGTYLLWIYIDLSQAYPSQENFIFRSITQHKINFRNYFPDQDFKVIRKSLIEAVKINETESMFSPSEILQKIESSYRKTGLGYFIVVNKTSDKYLHINIDSREIENVTLLPPFNSKVNRVFNLVLNPLESTIVLSIKNESYGSFWLNLKTSIKYCKINENKEYLNEVIEKCSMNSLIISKLYRIVDPTFYDYVLLPKEEAMKSDNINFKILDNKQISFDNLYQANSQYLKELIKLKPHSKNNLLMWKRINYQTGFYIGEINQDNKKHGRGMYLWDDGTCYIGYWENGQKTISGKIIKDSKTLYEGEFLKGTKNGKGIMYFENGSKYEGEFINDKRQGKGIFYWKNGTRWEGTFFNNQLHGEGYFFNQDNFKKSLKFENGQVMK